ncbi:DUF4127 family protein [Aneurinibacillus terranovensis]|uniref:DUF4127 family protein n=1 Tax=Aneurinibacillus terranovensis TaxID=278991 RepID=UPI00138AD964|nr:DUF4127 family protein [Aneurinibacillus terranovensis]
MQQEKNSGRYAQPYSSSLHGKKILLIPLDSRPVNTDYISLLAKIGGATVNFPHQGLDRFGRYANYEKIKKFLLAHISECDVVFIGIPEWLNGGIIAGRQVSTYTKNAYRLQELKSILKKYPKKKVYAINLIPRELPASSSPAFKYHHEIVVYGRRYNQYLTAKTADEKKRIQNIMSDIRKLVPRVYVEDYVRLFEQNMRVQRELAGWVKEGIIKEMLIGMDDTSSMGLPKVWERRLQHFITENHLSNVHVMTGADDLTCLLLARYKNESTHTGSRYIVTFSNEREKNNVLAYDGKPLNQVIQEKIRFLQPDPPADVSAPIYVYVHSQDETLDRVDRWANGNPHAIKGVADVVSSVSGDTTWMENFLRQNLEQKVESYSAWNTSGNTLGLLLSHLEMIRDQPTWNEANEKWLITRYIEDYYFNIIKRAEYVKKYASPDRLTRQEQDQICEEVKTRSNVFIRTLTFETMHGGEKRIKKPSFIVERAALPWGRIFEIHYRFRHL